MQNQVIHAGSMSWQNSPAGGVRRKRLFHSGAAEGGVVTSIVEYAAGSSFPEHGHPEGEEILVLDGTFSDERGDFARGSYFLNPEGFRHAPYSRRGCTIFVKLRQYAGTDRERVCVDTTRGDWLSAPWAAGAGGPVRSLPLYHSPRYPEHVQLLELAPGTRLAPLALAEGAEIFIVSGELEDDRGVHPAHTWLLLPPGSAHSPRCTTSALLYVRQGGFPADRQSTDGGR